MLEQKILDQLNLFTQIRRNNAGPLSFHIYGTKDQQQTNIIILWSFSNVDLHLWA